MTVTAIPKSSGEALPETSFAFQRVHDSAITSIAYHRCLCGGEYLSSERCQNHHVLSVVLTGCPVVYDGARRYLADPATALLHRPGSTYRTPHSCACNDSGIFIAFRYDVAHEVYRRLSRRDDAPTISLTVRPMRAALRQLVLGIRASRGLRADAVAMDEIVMDMLGSAVGMQPGDDVGLTGTGAAHRRTVNEARAYMNSNLNGPIHLDDIARAVGVSPFHLSRVFRRQTGLPLRTYLHHLRLSAATNELLGTDHSLTRIALETGFSSHAHFTTLFRRKLGVPPSHVRTLLGRRADVQESPLFAAGKFPPRG